ncbi:MAG: T9SS type A sorting domain-containing protein [Bacteroidota bacterium]
MRNIYLFLLFVLPFTLLKAQDNISIFLEGQNTDLSSGTSPYSVNAPSGATFDVTFEIHNNSAINQKWRITRKQLSVPAGWADGLCWGHSSDPFGGACYSSTQMTTNPWTSPGGAGVLFDILPGEYGKMKPDFNPADGVSGFAHYRYYITNSAGLAYLDSVDVIVDYVAENKPLKDPVTVSIVPNPADDYLQLSSSNAESFQFKMVDAMGAVLMKDVLTGSKKIATAEFKSGVYFLYFESTTSKPFTRKVIIRH